MHDPLACLFLQDELEMNLRSIEHEFSASKAIPDVEELNNYYYFLILLCKTIYCLIKNGLQIADLPTTLTLRICTYMFGFVFL